MANKHTIQELHQWQGLPLSVKIKMTMERVRAWVNEYGEDGVYVAFSGGKDSTVLLDIVRNRCGYKDVPAVFVDTGLEYPEIRQFVKSYDNVVWLRPKLTFKQVIQKYGYPFISKDVSRNVADVRKLGSNCFASKCFDGSMKNSLYNKEKWKFLINAPFDVSNKCCSAIKHAPINIYNKQTGRLPFTAQMAEESKQRKTQWLKNGCNGFDLKSPISNPLSFWTEQDILLYIKTYMIPPLADAWANIYNPARKKRKRARKALRKFNYRKSAICSVYGDIVEDTDGVNCIGQMTISDLEGWEDMELFDAERLPLKTTGCQRTGCMFCGFGCHLEKPGQGRFEKMKETHPKQYDYIMRPESEGGLNYKEIIDWINENGDFDIRY